MTLLQGLRAAGYEGEITFTAQDHAEAGTLKQADVGMVVASFAVAAQRVVDTVVASGVTSRKRQDD